MNGTAVRVDAHVCLGICTYQRPQMLRSCLQSVDKMLVPPRCRLTVIVVDNEAERAEEDLVRDYGARLEGHTYLYVHEPRRGISHARNAILRTAINRHADWIAMIDDDQLVPIDWLGAMWRSQIATEADVIRSSVDFLYPDLPSKWALPRKKKHRWKEVEHAATNGVLFDAALVNGSKMRLRFDEAYNLTGGEDRDFFNRAWRAGARIVCTPDAVITEIMPETKLSFSAQLWRSFWIELGKVRHDRRFYGFIKTMFFKSLKLVDSLLKGVVQFVLALLIGIINRRRGRERLLSSMEQFAKCAGIFVGLLGIWTPEPYRNIHGG